LSGTFFSLALLIGFTAKEPADLLLFNGRIFSANEKLATHSVMVVTDGKIVAVGDASLKSRFNAQDSVDLRGKLLIPGFNDTHQHVFGRSNRYIALDDVRSIRELKDLVRSKATELGEEEWITGYGWAKDDLAEKRRSLRWDFDLAEINLNTPDPEGGIIERDKTGKLNGTIRERQNIIGRLVPDPAWDELKPSFITNLRGLLKFGITSFIQAGATVEQWQGVYAEFG